MPAPEGPAHALRTGHPVPCGEKPESCPSLEQGELLLLTLPHGRANVHCMNPGPLTPDVSEVPATVTEDEQLATMQLRSVLSP